MDSDTKELLQLLGSFIFVVVLLFLIVMGAVGGFTTFWEYNTCQTMQTLHGDDYEFKWELYGGCLVKTNQNYWLNISKVDLIELNKLEKGEQ